MRIQTHKINTYNDIYPHSQLSAPISYLCTKKKKIASFQAIDQVGRKETKVQSAENLPRIRQLSPSAVPVLGIAERAPHSPGRVRPGLNAANSRRDVVTRPHGTAQPGTHVPRRLTPQFKTSPVFLKYKLTIPSQDTTSKHFIARFNFLIQRRQHVTNCSQFRSPRGGAALLHTCRGKIRGMNSDGTSNPALTQSRCATSSWFPPEPPRTEGLGHHRTCRGYEAEPSTAAAKAAGA